MDDSENRKYKNKKDQDAEIKIIITPHIWSDYLNSSIDLRSGNIIRF